jgi:hypothetical protein
VVEDVVGEVVVVEATTRKLSITALPSSYIAENCFESLTYN